MSSFRRRVIYLFTLLLIISCAMLGGAYHLSLIRTELSALSDSPVKWWPFAYPKTPAEDGGNHAEMISLGETIEYKFRHSGSEPYPYASFHFNFFDPATGHQPVDISSYEGIAFEMQCSPRYLMKLELFTFDDSVSTPGRWGSYRVADHFFKCDGRKTAFEFPFSQIKSARWWQDKFELLPMDVEYSLEKTFGFAFVGAPSELRDTYIRVKLGSVNLYRHNYAVVYGAAGVCALMWLGFIGWIVRYCRDRAVSLARDSVAHSQKGKAVMVASISPEMTESSNDLNTQHEGEVTSADGVNRVIMYISENYSNSEISLDMAATALDMSKREIAKTMKTYLATTFNAHVNKVRLTEATRLLNKSDTVSVSEVAFSVGFNNVAYFNKLFKLENGCTPTQFRAQNSWQLSQQTVL